MNKLAFKTRIMTRKLFKQISDCDLCLFNAYLNPICAFCQRTNKLFFAVQDRTETHNDEFYFWVKVCKNCASEELGINKIFTDQDFIQSSN